MDKVSCQELKQCIHHLESSDFSLPLGRQLACLVCGQRNKSASRVGPLIGSGDNYRLPQHITLFLKA